MKKPGKNKHYIYIVTNESNSYKRKIFHTYLENVNNVGQD